MTEDNTVQGAALALREPSSLEEPPLLTIEEGQRWWTRRQLAGLKALGIKNATDDDLLLFFHYCARTGLDPFSKQIYLIERRTWNKDARAWEYRQVIQVGIDGFRVLAQRAAIREGVFMDYLPTVWTGPDKSKHEVWLETGVPAAATVTVRKHLPDGRILDYPGVAKFESYAARGKVTEAEPLGPLLGQWAVMDDHMIEKCAEAFALRRAFPNDLGGMYVEEELQRGGGGLSLSRVPKPPKMATRLRPTQEGDENVTPGEVVQDVPAIEASKASVMDTFTALGVSEEEADFIVAGITARHGASGQPVEWASVAAEVEAIRDRAVIDDADPRARLLATAEEVTS